MGMMHEIMRLLRLRSSIVLDVRKQGNTTELTKLSCCCLLMESLPELMKLFGRTVLIEGLGGWGKKKETGKMRR